MNITTILRSAKAVLSSSSISHLATTTSSSRKPRFFTSALLVLSFVFSLLRVESGWGQYCNTATSNDLITPTATAQLTTSYSTGRRAFNFTATAGCKYVFSTCGQSTSDTYLGLYSTASGGTLLAGNDDFCSAQSQITWTCPSNGAYSILLTRYTFSAGVCAALNNATRVSYYIAPPAQPSAIVGTLNPEPGTSQSYSVTNVTGTSYNWTFPSSWTITAGQGTNSVTVTVGTQNGTISVSPTACIAGTASTITTTIPNYRWKYISSTFGSSTWSGGENRNLSLTIKNTGVGTWNSGVTTNLGVRWDSDNSAAAFAPWTDYHSRVTTGVVASGAQVTLSIPIQAKNATAGPVYGSNLADGNYYLAFDLVNEGSCWFANNTGTCGPGNIVFYSAVQTVSTVPTLSCTALTAFGNVCTNATPINSFTISGVNLTNNVSVASLAGYSYSTTLNGTYTSTLTLTPSSGALNQTIYVKFTPTLAQAYSGNIVVSSPGATSINVAASGTGLPAPTVNAGPDVTICNGSTTSLSGSSTATATTGTTSSGAVTASGTDNTNFTANYTFSGIPTGATITGITVNITSAGGTYCPSWYSVTTWINGVQQGAAGCTGSTNYTNFNGQNPNGLLISVRCQDNDGWGDAATITYTATVTWSYFNQVWSPSTALSSTTSLTPTCSATTTTNYTLTATSGNGCSANDQVLVTVNSCPALNATALASNGSVCVGSTSTATSFNISGINLTGNVTVTAPAGFLLSYTSGGSYSSSLVFPTASGTLASSSVFVKFNPTLTQAYSGNIVVSSPGATSINVAASGTGLASPVVNAGPDVTICNGSTTTFSGVLTPLINIGTTSSGNVTASGNDNTNFTANYTFSGLPAGSVITGISINITSAGGTNCPGWYSATTWINGVQQGVAGCAGVISYSNFNGQSANGLLISVRCQDNDAWADAATITYTATITYSNYLSNAWTPSTGLSSTTSLTPTCSATSTTNYSLTATSGNGCSSSDQVLVTVLPLPTQPVASTAGTYCNSTTLTATNGSSGTIYFQGTNASGTSTAAPSVSEVISTSGTYYFRAYNGTCWGNSGSAAITINTQPIITSQPITSDVTRCQSSQVFPALSVTATGTNLTYQWYSNTSASNSNGILVSGATSASYVPSNANTGTLYYYCVVSSASCPSTTSNVSGAMIVVGSPSAPTVSPANLTVNVGASASFTATLNNSSNSLKWWDAAANGNQIDPDVTTSGLDDATFNSYQAQVSPPTSNNTPTPNVAFCTPNTTYTYYVEEFDGTCPSARTPITITTNPLVSINNSTLCQSGATATLTANITLGSGTIQWSQSTDSVSFVNIVGANNPILTVTPTVTNIYRLNGSALTPFGCSILNPLPPSLVNVDKKVVYYPPVDFTPTAVPSDVCLNGTVQLNSNLSSGNFSVSTIPYLAYTVPSNAVTVVINGAAVSPFTNGNGTNFDDGGFPNIPIPFTYNFFGNNYTSVAAGTNAVLMFGNVPGYDATAGNLGWYQFSQNASNCNPAGASSGQVFPNCNNPANIIALMAGDQTFANNVSWWTGAITNYNPGKIKYWTSGLTPTRVFNILYENVPKCCSATDPTFTGYVRLIETTGVVEIHILNKNSTNSSTIGLQNASKTIGATAPNRIAFTSQITTPEAYRFTPSANYNYSWSTQGSVLANSNAASITSLPFTAAGTSTYTVNAESQTTGCTASKNVTITVNALPAAPNSGGNVTTCTNSASTTLTATAQTGCVVEWYSTNTATGSPLATGNAYTFTPSSTAGTYTYYAFARNSNTSCASSLATSVVLTVVQAPISPSTTAALSYCQGASAVPLAATGTALTWYQGTNVLTGTPTPVTSAATTLNYSVTQTVSGCPSNPATITVTVIGTPSLTNSSLAESICDGLTFTPVTLTSNSSGAASFAWTASASSPSVTGFTSSGSTASSPAIIAGQTIANTSNLVQTVTYAITPTNTVGSLSCPGPVSNYVISVNPSLTASVVVNASTTSVCTGGAITFTATPTNGGTSPSYQWFLNSTTTPVAGQTSATYTLASPVAGDQVFVKMTSSPAPNCLISSTNPATSNTITLNTAPATPVVNIVQSTPSTTVCSGTSVNFSIATSTALGSNPTYQWLLNGTAISGATSATYTTSSLVNNDVISLLVTSSIAANCLTQTTATSQGITMLVTPITTITSQPVGVSVCQGATPVLSSTASGTGTLTYQWQSCTSASATTGTNLSSVSYPTALTTSLTTPAAGATPGYYRMVATGTCGSATSDIATISINTPTAITTPPAAQAICEGTTATFTTVAQGQGTISYQWLFNGSTISGANSASYAIPNLASSNAGLYSVAVTATCGTVTSSAVQLTVNPLTTISTQPVNASICDSTILSLSVVASGTAPISYQWYRGTTQITSASSTPGVYLDNVGTVAESGLYTVVVSGGCSNATSAAATVVVSPNTWITAQPVSYTGCALNPTSLSVSGLGANLQYQWYIGSNPSTAIPGATSATYNLSNPQTSNSGSYTVTLTGANNGQCGTQTSNIALVTINPVPSAGTISGGNSGVCVGSTINLTNLASGGVWTSSNPALGSISSTGVLTGVSAGTITVTYTVTNSFGCVSTATKVIQVKGLPTALIQTPLATSICQGEAMNLQSSNAISYLWSNGATTQNISVNSSATGTVNYSVTVTGTNACTATSAPLAITVIPVPTVAAITGTGNYPNFCLGNTSNLASATANGIWSSSNTNILTVNPLSGAANTLTIGTATVSYYVANVPGCLNPNPGTATATITVSTPPAAFITSSGSTTFCQGGSITLTAPSGVGYNYLWSTGATTQTITVSTSGSYSLTVTATGGCSVTSLPTIVTVLPIPTATIFPTGAINICSGTNVTLSTGSAVSYVWSNGANTPTISVNAAGNYSVTLTGTNGCTVTSAVSTVTVTPVPSAVITANGPTNICDGGSVGLSVPTAGSYLWSNGATTQGISATSTGNYSVTATNGICSATSTPTYVNFNPVPSSTVTASGPTTFCQGGNVTLTAATGNSFTYLWSNGATTQSITVAASGTYSVTVSNSFNCSSTSTPISVVVNALPTASITAGGSTTICSGNSLSLTATSANAYLWSTGATTQSINVSVAGNYTVEAISAAGCTATSSVLALNVLPSPTAIITQASGTTFCQGGGVVINSTPASAYLWSNNETTQAISATTTGVYSVLVTAANGCTATSNAINVNVLPIPTAVIYPGTNVNICAGSTVTLSTGTAASYTWSNGANTPTITVGSNGTHTVTLTGSNGCTATSAVSTITVNPIPVATITAAGSTNICSGTSVNLTASTAGSYLWSNGATTQTIAASLAGAYTVTVTTAGCSATSASTSVNVNPAPTALVTASGPTSFCQGGSVSFTANAGNGYTYLWSNGETTSSITSSITGNFTVTVSNQIGCSTTSVVNAVVVNPIPVATITAGGSTTICSGSPVSLSAPAGSNYLWNTGSTSQSINAATAGNYTVVVTSAAGCSATSAPTTIMVNALPSAAISSSGSTTFCQGATISLSTTGGLSSYLWSTGETTSSLNVTTSGNYTVTVTNSNGCSATSSPTVVNVLTAPTALIYPGTNVNICAGSTVTLSTGTAASYAWSNGANTPTITVGANGTHTVTLTGSNGCTATSAVSTITVNPIPVATITAAGSTNICSGTSVNLTASTAGSYLWSNGATTQTIAASLAGAYTVTVTTAGCSATSASTSVNVNPAPTALVTASGPTSFCQGGSVSFTANAGNGYTYLWNNGETTATISTSTSGNNSVTVTNLIGCSTTSAVNAVVVNPIPVATITAGGSTTICSGTSVSLAASAGASYLWSNGATAQTINASLAGNYAVTVTSAAGCSANSIPTLISVNALPSASISSSGSTTICQGSSVSLSATNGMSSYLWSTGATSATVAASTSGNYTVTVTNSNGCSATSSPTVVNVLAAPTAVIYPGTNVSICAGSTVTLSTGTASSFAWSNGANTPTITVGANGTHTVTLTGSNGCTATSAVTTIAVNPIPVATITAAGSTNICSGTSVNLTASTAGSYLWSNGATTQTIAASLAGTYTVTVTTAGCSATSSGTSINVNPAPSAMVTASGPTSFCQGGSVSFTANAGNGYTYLWSNGATTASITTSTAGNNTVTVTNQIGCSTTSAINAVVVNPIPVATITAGGSTTICSGSSVSLSASAGASYLWSNGATTQSINASLPVNYTVTVTSAAGCSASSSPTLISLNALPVAAISSSGSTTICQGSSVSLSATNGMSTYLWNTGATTASLTATTPGNYSVTVTNSNGCSATSSPTTVTVNQGPVAQIYPGTNVTICSGTNVTLSTPSATSYSWSNGSNTPTIQVSTAGTYTVTLTGSNGCSSTSPVTTVVVTPTPAATITSSGPTTICQGSSVTLSAPGSASTYLWSNGATTQSITASLVGSYFVTVGSNGCNATSPSTYVSYNPVPSAAVTANGPTTFCIGNSVTFSAPAGNGNTYLWNNGATTQTINTAIAGNFSVTVTNGYGCSATSTNNPVLVNPLPVVTPITGSSSICAGTQGQVSNVMTGGVYASSNLGVASIGQLNGQITGLTAGTTTVSYIYTNSNGCSNTVTYPVTIIAAPVATITAGGPTTFCQGGSVVLTASSGTAYAWSNGATTASITVSASGSYSVSVTGANGCSATSQATTVNVLTPSSVSAINGANSVCVNSATSFTNATSGGTWSTSNPLIATVSTAGNVTGVSAGSATITYAINSTNGCQNAATKVVTVNAVPATALTASGATTFCQGSNVSLTASTGSTYLWSTGATTSSITAATSGTYNVTVTNANGCSSVSTNQLITVNANPTASISTNGSTNLCTGGSIVLMATPSSSYVWNTGATTSSITATTAGSYSVTVTNANGCSATSTATSVVVNASPSATVTASGPASICSGSNVVLSATSVVGNTYQWSNNGVLISGATSASYTATTSGTYAVTVTNASGCSATSTTTPVSVVLATAATITPSGSTSLCSGSSVVLAANAGSSYLWSTGATTQSITVNTAANYSVTVTNALGCSATSTVLPVVVNAAPTATITAGGPTTFCQGGNVVLTASSGASYVWSNGATTASITASTPGSYSVLITNASGCAATAAATAVTVNAAPNATISAGGSTTFCSGGSVTLTASAGASYLWSTGATTASISVNTAGASTVTVTNAAGCSSTSAATTIVVNATPTASITAGGSTTICSGSTVTLTASAGSSYAWSNGATTASIVANTTGNYTVTVFNANGCSAISTPTTVTVNNPSVANISSSGSTNFCQGGSVVLTATAASTYAWSTGATTQTITVSASGNYSVTLTNASGCTSSSPVTVVTANALPTATITAGGATTFCQGGSVTLTASPATSYVWSNGATSASITVSTAGSYTVQVANNSGCTATSAATTVVVNALPSASITAGGSLSICAGSTVNLTASTGAAYLWSNGATTATIAASNAGNYSVQVTNAAGCISTSAVSSVVVNALPTPSISSVGSTTLCQGASVTLTTANGPGLTYQWQNNGTNVPGATAASFVANTAGSYTVQVTNAAGCSNTTSATTVVVNALPVASIANSGSNTICAGSSVNLTASAGTAYAWSNGATTASIAVNATGNYTVSITNAAGCTSSASTAITVVTPTVASITANGPTSFCAGQNVTLTANTGASYLWNTGATTASITASTTSNPTVQVTYASGCSSTSAIMPITVNALPAASITANGATSFCPGSTVTLTASAGTSYAWTNGATTNSIVVSASGSYGVSVTNASGCVATAIPTAITVFAVPIASITTSGATTFCQGSTLNLTANTGASYVWSSGETTSSISTGVSGNYSVTVFNANGCSAVSSIVPVTVNANPVATIQANGPTTVCQGSTVVLTSNGGTGFTWSNTETTSSISVTTSGTYGVTVTNAAGCSTTVSPVAVTVNPVQVLSPITGANSVCVGAITTYANTTSGGTWSSDNTAVATVNSTSGIVSGVSSGAATIKYQFVNASGCVSEVTKVVTVNTIAPVSISASSATSFCQGGSVTLTAPAGLNYNWTSGQTTQSITVSTSGAYALAVSNTAGCFTTSSTVQVTVNPAPVVNITSTSTTLCQGTTLVLNAPSNAASYAWSNGATTQSVVISSAGTYALTITDANGCSASTNTTIVNGINPQATVSAGGATTFCQGGTVVLNAAGGTSFLWNNGATTQNISVTTPGNYSVMVTNAAGCSSMSNSTLVNVLQAPNAVATAYGPTTFCQGGSVTIATSGGTSYAWSNGSTAQSILPTTSGTYSVIITGANGCTATSNAINVTVNPIPTAVITPSGATTFCEGSSVNLVASGGASYAWNNGSTATTLTATTGGVYTVTVTNAGGCTDTETLTVTVNEVPSDFIVTSGSTTFCQGGEVSLTAQAGNSYVWSNNATTQSIAVTTAGTYSVSILSPNGCSVTSNAITVDVNQPSSSNLIATAYDGYTLNGILYTQSGTYTQTLTNAAGCDSTITLELTLTVGIEEGTITDVSLYPNPTSESFTIQTSIPLYCAYSVVDAQGKLVFEGVMTGTETQVNISSVARGIYYLRIRELSEPLRVVKN
jgi:hypothetical protein